MSGKNYFSKYGNINNTKLSKINHKQLLLNNRMQF